MGCCSSLLKPIPARLSSPPAFPELPEPPADTLVWALVHAVWCHSLPTCWAFRRRPQGLSGTVVGSGKVLRPRGFCSKACTGKQLREGVVRRCRQGRKAALPVLGRPAGPGRRAWEAWPQAGRDAAVDEDEDGRGRRGLESSALSQHRGGWPCVSLTSTGFCSTGAGVGGTDSINVRHVPRTTHR